MKPARLALWLALPVLAAVAIWSLQAEEKKEAPKSDDAWLTSYDKALTQAKAEKKVVLADFTGSDWCGFCIKLKHEVLDTDEFKTWAKQNVVLLELDYPRQKQQSDEVKKQNQELAKKFGVDGFPTVLVLDGEGKELARIVGYAGKEEWWKDAKAGVAKAKG